MEMRDPYVNQNMEYNRIPSYMGTTDGYTSTPTLIANEPGEINSHISLPRIHQISSTKITT